MKEISREYRNLEFSRFNFFEKRMMSDWLLMMSAILECIDSIALPIQRYAVLIFLKADNTFLKIILRGGITQSDIADTYKANFHSP